MQAGDTKKYYHGTLDKTFPVKITKVTKTRVSFKILEGPLKGASRSMTKKQAEELL